MYLIGLFVAAGVAWAVACHRWRWARRWPVVVLVGLMVYVGGYTAARYTGSIVHYVGYRTDPAGERVVAEHHVTTGGMRDPAAPPRSPVAAWLFTPLRLVEQFGWYLMAPAGSAWSEASGKRERPFPPSIAFDAVRESSGRSSLAYASRSRRVSWASLELDRLRSRVDFTPPHPASESLL